MRITLKDRDFKSAKKIESANHTGGSITNNGVNASMTLAPGSVMSSSINSANLHGSLK